MLPLQSRPASVWPLPPFTSTDRTRVDGGEWEDPLSIPIEWASVMHGHCPALAVTLELATRPAARPGILVMVVVHGSSLLGWSRSQYWFKITFVDHPSRLVHVRALVN
jgi:hypothetical protein